MAVFSFPYHTYSTEYPESGYRMKFGNAYDYATEPTGPDQRIITLNFATMKFYEAPGGGIDRTREPAINMALLEDFYLEHRLWKSFTYNHPIYGAMQVKFNKPLKVPEGIQQGDGALKAFSIELIEQP